MLKLLLVRVLMMEISCVLEEDPKNHALTKKLIEEIVIGKQAIENADDYEYIECTPLLLDIGIESDDGADEKNGINSPKLQCSSCEYKTKRRDLLLSHSMLHEKETSLVIYKGQQQATQRAFTMLQRGEQYFYKCIRCFYLTAAWPEIKRHVRRKHTVESAYSCDWCSDFASPNLAHLKWHVERYHWRNLPYRCENCKFAAWRLREFQMHKLKHYSVPDTLTCALCDAKSSNRKAFVKHLRGHSATFCHDCNRWVNNNSVERHKMRHINKERNIGKKKKIKR